MNRILRYVSILSALVAAMIVIDLGGLGKHSRSEVISGVSQRSIGRSGPIPFIVTAESGPVRSRRALHRIARPGIELRRDFSGIYGFERSQSVAEDGKVRARAFTVSSLYYLGYAFLCGLTLWAWSDLSPKTHLPLITFIAIAELVSLILLGKAIGLWLA